MSDLLPKVTVNLGDSLPFLWEKMLGLVGRDAATKSLKAWFEDLQNSSFLRASTIQCVGMHTPLPMQDLYRPTKIFWQVSRLTLPVKQSKLLLALAKKRQARISELQKANTKKLGPIGERNDDGSLFDERIDIVLPQHTVSSSQFLKVPTSAIITAGPGWGKTTFLNFLYLSHLESKDFVPILIPLGRKGSLEDLQLLLELTRAERARSAESQFLLLVDGYDEISTEDRREVSNSINSLVATDHVRAYIACRSFYDVYDLKFPQVKIAEFDLDDQSHYARAFMHAYGCSLDPDAVLQELRERGLDDLLRHPLLLALVCIVKSGAQSVKSKNVLDLIARALESLSFRWDEWKGIDREQSTPLDGKARLHCLMRVAHQTDSVSVSDHLVMRAVREQLDKYRWDDLDERKVVLEIARFFGILVPADESYWCFVHRTLYDYLAACFITENGGLRAWESKKYSTQWAYAACRSADATSEMKECLSSRHFEVFIEMLSNDAPFNHAVIADALLEWYRSNRGEKRYGERIDSFSQSADGETYTRIAQPFLHLASSKFLHYLAEHSSRVRGKAEDTFLAYAMAELKVRKVTLSQDTLANLKRKFRADEELFVFIDGAYQKVFDGKSLTTPRSRF